MRARLGAGGVCCSVGEGTERPGREERGIRTETAGYGKNEVVVGLF